MVHESYRLERGSFGKKMVLTGKWTSDLREVANEEEVIELSANYAHGWERDDLEFLNSLPQLVSLEIVDWNLEDVSAIHCLPNLRALQVHTYCKTPIDFGCFPVLEELDLEWRARAKSVFDCKSLKRVFINHFAGNDLSPLLALPRVIDLQVATPKISAIGEVGPAPTDLSLLGIYVARKLKSLEGVQKLQTLHELHVDGCGSIHDISPIASLTSLRTLYLRDNRDIDSFLPLQSLSELRELLFSGTTSVQDGKIRFLASAGLETVAFQDRRHYDAKRSDFPM